MLKASNLIELSPACRIIIPLFSTLMTTPLNDTLPNTVIAGNSKEPLMFGCGNVALLETLNVKPGNSNEPLTIGCGIPSDIEPTISNAGSVNAPLTVGCGNDAD